MWVPTSPTSRSSARLTGRPQGGTSTAARRNRADYSGSNAGVRIDLNKIPRERISGMNGVPVAARLA